MPKRATPRSRKPAAKPPAPATPAATVKTKASRPVADTPEGLAAYKDSLGRKIRVKATQTGFVDNVRRREGDVFDVREGEFSERWMEVVDGTTPPKSTGSAAALKAHHDAVLASRGGVQQPGAGAAVKVQRSSGDKDVLS